ncbi:hypothetical protein MTBBW1_1310054 [Desulfamplus magnetovallimortis]|uniref:Uncharacterized protein n=1 Tax=Desulfamplus magnetovallimortis TaxID=1246637 RepID=A0A1W1H7E7_9BACT|nr:hypothetical protein [Desulfamplus magnetovallimortis]SLM28356.1 hypothetical protein MTBBW1_1310054 [Desulfamplus magnetovallimortis]
MALIHVTVSVNNLRNDGKAFESQFLVDILVILIQTNSATAKKQ